MTDYRQFLGRKETFILPFIGGEFVSAPGRRLRITAIPADHGWYCFSVSGRVATAQQRVDAPDLSGLPALRGHVVGDRLFTSGRAMMRVALLEEPPLPLSRVNARRWHDGTVLFESVEFDTESEDAARRCVEERSGLSTITGVSPSLRAAFAWHITALAAELRDMWVSPLELFPHVRDLADNPALAEAVLTTLAERRELERTRRLAAAVVQHPTSTETSTPPAVYTAGPRSPDGQARQRAERALAAAGAELLGAHLSGALLEVAFRFLGERFVSVVDPHTLHVHDAGICLDGADEELTLESLPSVIREAVDTHRLNITRW